MNTILLIIIGVLVVCNIATLFLLFRFNKSLKSQKEEFERIIKNNSKHAQNQIDFLAKFLARVSYEIRSSLNAAFGFSNLILDKRNLDVDVVDNALKIRDSCVALMSIVNDIADVSKTYGKPKLNIVDYDTADLLNEVISVNSAGVKTKLIKFIFDIDKNLPSRLIGDDFRVRQIFVNMLSNALKSAKSGTVEWKLNFERNDDFDVWLVSKIKLEKPFEDTDLGLELVLAKRNIDIMDGTINVESENGKNSVFTVKIKQYIQDATPIGEDWNTKPKLVFAQMPDINVLIVDDILLNLEVTRGLMSRYGMHVDTAPSGRVAIAKMMNKSKKYSAIFMDYMMPEMDGIETVRKIRELDDDYAKNIPIIAITANILDTDEKMFLEKGFNDFMSKPVDIAKLDAILKKWVMHSSGK